MEDTGKIEIIDPKEFRMQKQDERSFRAVIMDYIRVIGKLSKVEFRGGYWITKNKTLPGGVLLEEKVYVPDTREEYCNAIDWLHDMLMPYFDDKEKGGTKEMKSAALTINRKLEKIREEYLSETEEEEILNEDEGKIDKALEVYKFKKLRLHRELFQEISKFLKENNYFDDLGGIEE